MSAFEGNYASGRAQIGTHSSKVGEWLSLVEHLVRDQGVGGSNPLSPTNKSNKISQLRNCQVPAKPELGYICVQVAMES